MLLERTSVEFSVCMTIMAVVAKMQTGQPPAEMKMLVQVVESGFSCC